MSKHYLVLVCGLYCLVLVCEQYYLALVCEHALLILVWTVCELERFSLCEEALFNLDLRISTA